MIKKPKKLTPKKLKELLWEECKRIIRAKYGNTCFTCGKRNLEGSGWHTGHFIPSSVGGFSLRYELRNLRPQCYYCNINLGGNGSAFYKNLVEIEGQEYVDELFRLKQKIIKGDTIYLSTLLEEYKKVK